MRGKLIILGKMLLISSNRNKILFLSDLNIYLLMNTQKLIFVFVEIGY